MSFINQPTSLGGPRFHRLIVVIIRPGCHQNHVGHNLDQATTILTKNRPKSSNCPIFFWWVYGYFTQIFMESKYGQVYGYLPIFTSHILLYNGFLETQYGQRYGTFTICWILKISDIHWDEPQKTTHPRRIVVLNMNLR